ncbi:hypothetical protein T02_15986 [Trichinella nativa]|uniref:Uncharacterized protein n=1 Tax=Trichinella nativa TaxID=6335 RepID=A0A0V1KIV5_9BILA|nr:hypothetical protein T02_15986 [Trichinella nativa]
MHFGEEVVSDLQLLKMKSENKDSYYDCILEISVFNDASEFNGLLSSC